MRTAVVGLTRLDDRAATLCTLATIKRDGRPQLSQVGYAYELGLDLLRVSVTDSRAKVKNLRRDPRATVLVLGEGRWQYAVAEVRAELHPVTTDPGDASADKLVDIYRTLAGEHPTGTSSGRRWSTTGASPSTCTSSASTRIPPA